MRVLSVDYDRNDGVLALCVSNVSNDGIIHVKYTETINRIFSEEAAMEICKFFYNKLKCNYFISEDLNFKPKLTVEIPIEFLDLSVRQYKCLKREGINTYKELSKYTKQDLLKVRNLSKWNVEDLLEKGYIRS